MNMVVTNNDIGGALLSEGKFEDALLTFTAAGTVKEGTILAKDSVSKKYVPYVKGGVANENGIPKAVLITKVVATAAGDVPIRPLLSGDLRKEKTIIHADGDDSNIDSDVKDQLRDYGIHLIPIKELNILDNQ